MNSALLAEELPPVHICMAEIWLPVSSIHLAAHRLKTHWNR